MLEATLQETLKRIFDLKKCTFDSVSESREQECIFVEVDSNRGSIKDGVEVFRVEGRIRVFANRDKLPLGYFAKKIHEADPTDTQDLFFFDIEQNLGIIQNIVERTVSFVYLYSGQYDPALGTITSIEISEAQ